MSKSKLKSLLSFTSSTDNGDKGRTVVKYVSATAPPQVPDSEGALLIADSKVASPDGEANYLTESFVTTDGKEAAHAADEGRALISRALHAVVVAVSRCMMSRRAVSMASARSGRWRTSQPAALTPSPHSALGFQRPSFSQTEITLAVLWASRAPFAAPPSPPPPPLTQSGLRDWGLGSGHRGRQGKDEAAPGAVRREDVSRACRGHVQDTSMTGIGTSR